MKKQTYNSSSRLISVTERLLISKLHEEFNKNNVKITVEQWRLLFYLWSEDGVNQRDLSIRANKEKSTIARQIVDLEKKGLIFRTCSKPDKRNKLIFLTDEGRNIKKRSLKIADSITEKAEKNISVADLNTVKKVLDQMIKNIIDDDF
ncbi:MarR family transcriptional regulator [uncultured Tenacibaculum sp.]|uniref:MarR family winged helix-turn-helix transcriptional regulator n=1 Tax=uncultured Tenacibaculum sp. TaxID=174713 RepID=UPI0026268A82|nr:MarR family transcriptional regulator [uncultured Tenacibaculum sp.]